MPLNDHFTRGVNKRFRWEGFHAHWTVNIVRRLNGTTLPAAYHAEPRVRLGTEVEIDIGTLEPRPRPEPAETLVADRSKEDVFEVQVFDDETGEALVAAIELVSPGNKDRPQSRHDFVVKCASLLKAQVSLVVVDIVTNRQPNLFHELAQYLEIRDVKTPLGAFALYACSLLPRGSNGHAKIDVWPAELQLDAPLPSLPLWLRDDLAVALELELTYEETCRDLRA